MPDTARARTTFQNLAKEAGKVFQEAGEKATKAETMAKRRAAVPEDALEQLQTLRGLCSQCAHGASLDPQRLADFVSRASPLCRLPHAVWWCHAWTQISQMLHHCRYESAVSPGYTSNTLGACWVSDLTRLCG